ncbi:sensor histidine kinase [Nocardioides humi]|uniref:histidine kinase n=1 Tax=Nocardioides humi TaxID=449461 RepID=A0ABN2AWK5_9ACTN|nr:HAMP domain-containing sensor histidine kinase [Nocardioides humi]
MQFERSTEHDAGVHDVRVHDYEARLHEATSMVAGIASAAELLPTLDEGDRSGLESMMLAELRRLQRVLSGAGGDQIQSVDVDDVVAPLVATHRARSRKVSWRPSGARALGSADVLAEALNVLLDNAAAHGTPDDIRIEVRTVDHRLQVAVVDGGPGVGDRMRRQLFARGARRPGSTGRGIGLHVARARLRDGGGDLRLDRAAPTRFVIELPAAGHPSPTGRRRHEASVA